MSHGPLDPPEIRTGSSRQAEAGVRSRYGVTVVDIKSYVKDFSYATPTSAVEENDLIIVSGDRGKVEHFSDQE